MGLVQPSRVGRQVRPDVRQAEQVGHAAVAGFGEGAVQVPLPPREAQSRPRAWARRGPPRVRGLGATTAPTTRPRAPAAAPWRTGSAGSGRPTTAAAAAAPRRADGGTRSAASRQSPRHTTPARRSSAERPGTGTSATLRCRRRQEPGLRTSDAAPEHEDGQDQQSSRNRHHPELGRAPGHELEGSHQQREARVDRSAPDGRDRPRASGRAEPAPGCRARSERPRDPAAARARTRPATTAFPSGSPRNPRRRRRTRRDSTS